MMQVKPISDNEIYLLIKYIKSILWRVGNRLSYTEDARCLTVKNDVSSVVHVKTELPVFSPKVSYSCTR